MTVSNSIPPANRPSPRGGFSSSPPDLSRVTHPWLRAIAARRDPNQAPPTPPPPAKPIIGSGGGDSDGKRVHVWLKVPGIAPVSPADAIGREITMDGRGRIVAQFGSEHDGFWILLLLPIVLAEDFRKSWARFGSLLGSVGRLVDDFWPTGLPTPDSIVEPSGLLPVMITAKTDLFAGQDLEMDAYLAANSDLDLDAAAVGVYARPLGGPVWEGRLRPSEAVALRSMLEHDDLPPECGRWSLEPGAFPVTVHPLPHDADASHGSVPARVAIIIRNSLPHQVASLRTALSGAARADLLGYLGGVLRVPGTPNTGNLPPADVLIAFRPSGGERAFEAVCAALQAAANQIEGLAGVVVLDHPALDRPVVRAF